MFSRTTFSRLPKPLSCRIIAPLLTKYVEAEAAMSAAERGAVNAHLDLCPVCREETAATRAMGAFLRDRGPAALPTYTPSPDLWERIENRIVTEQRDSRRAFSLRPVLLFAPALAAVIVAVVFAPKQQQQHSETASTQTPKASAAEKANPVRAAKKSVTMVAMEESRTTRRSSAVVPPPMPSVSLTPPTGIKIAARRLTGASASFKSDNRAASGRHQTAAAGFVAAVKVVPRPRDTQSAKRVAQNVPQLKMSPSPITIVDVDPTPAPVRLASARVRATTEFRPATPTASSAGEESLSDRHSFANAHTITVVRTDPGTGVSAAAYAPPPVTDTMMRQRQRRGLFGGYGSAAVLGVLPGRGSGGSDSDTPTGSETGTPW